MLVIVDGIVGRPNQLGMIGRRHPRQRGAVAVAERSGSGAVFCTAREARGEGGARGKDLYQDITGCISDYT